MLHDAANVTSREIAHVVIDQPRIAVVDAKDVGAQVIGRTHDGADSCVHAGGVPTASEDSDLGHREVAFLSVGTEGATKSYLCHKGGYVSIAEALTG